jgi:hypothetical protein
MKIRWIVKRLLREHSLDITHQRWVQQVIRNQGNLSRPWHGKVNLSLSGNGHTGEKTDQVIEYCFVGDDTIKKLSIHSHLLLLYTEPLRKWNSLKNAAKLENPFQTNRHWWNPIRRIQLTSSEQTQGNGRWDKNNINPETVESDPLSQLMSLRSILILSSHLHEERRRNILISTFSDQNIEFHISPMRDTCHAHNHIYYLI